MHFQAPTQWGLERQSGTSAHAIHAVLSHFCCDKLWSQTLGFFFLYSPLTYIRDPEFYLWVPPIGPPYGARLVRTEPFSGTHGLVEITIFG